MGITFSQFFPPTPTLTEANLPNQTGKVFIVTGGTSGVGYELCKILYQAGGKVYVAGRSEVKAKEAITKLKSLASTTPGSLVFLPVSLDDLTTIKPAVETFTSQETRLDVLFNNAGVSHPPYNVKSSQGHEMQMATNCLGHYLFTQLLLPVLISTAKDSELPADVRVVWTSSIAVDLGAPRGGFVESDLHDPGRNAQRNYAVSKAGNWFLASELAQQVSSHGVLSVTQNPGNLQTSLLRYFPTFITYLVSPMLYDARFGAYTELWAGLSKDLNVDDGGLYIVPWGRRHSGPRQDLLDALRGVHEGGTGQAKVFRDYCEKQTERFR